jgi:hypothetical protein
MPKGVGDKFQEETKYYRERLGGGGLDWANEPDVYKKYPDAGQVKLPRFDSIKTLPVRDVLKRRKSIRHFSGDKLTGQELSYLLWASGGIQRVERGHEFRTAPSAGALYPIETYVIADGVEGVRSGLYH